MDEIIQDTEDKLLIQQKELGERIRLAEDALMRDKEMYLKVTGALEGIGIIRQRMAPQLSETSLEE